MKDSDRDEQGRQKFDADYGPENPINRRAAAERGLKYDSNSNCYVDEDGLLILDRFGQPLG